MFLSQRSSFKTKFETLFVFFSVLNTFLNSPTSSVVTEPDSNQEHFRISWYKFCIYILDQLPVWYKDCGSGPCRDAERYQRKGRVSDNQRAGAIRWPQ